MSKTDAEPTTRRCNCGCGEATSSSKAMYKPGHDARHAGNVGRAIAADRSKQDELLAPLTPALRVKALRVADNASKPAAVPAPTHDDPRLKDGGQVDDGKGGVWYASGGKVVHMTAAKLAAAEAHMRDVPPASALDEDGQLTDRDFDDDTPVTPEPMFGDELDGPSTHLVKIGRWEYPARIAQDNTVERNTKRDGTGDWIHAPKDLELIDNPAYLAATTHTQEV